MDTVTPARAPARRGRPRKQPVDAAAASIPRPEVAAPPEFPRDTGPVRAAPRAIDPRAEADRYVAEYDIHNADNYEGPDKYHIDENIIPPGWDYNWKRFTIYNQQDPSYQVALARGGWRAVPTNRHPELMPQGSPGEAPIVHDGLMLMERPLELSNRARIKDRRDADAAVKAKEQQAGHAPAGQLDRVQPSIKKSYAPIPVQADRAG